MNLTYLHLLKNSNKIPLNVVLAKSNRKINENPVLCDFDRYQSCIMKNNFNILWDSQSHLACVS